MHLLLQCNDNSLQTFTIASCSYSSLSSSPMFLFHGSRAEKVCHRRHGHAHRWTTEVTNSLQHWFYKPCSTGELEVFSQLQLLSFIHLEAEGK